MMAYFSYELFSCQLNDVKYGTSAALCIQSGQTANDSSCILTKREVKIAGYWASSLFALLWTETKSRSIKTQKENEANTQPF